ncbi:MAG: DOPA 4,5-dioxygenase family protein [Pseudomonadota bacterium]
MTQSELRTAPARPFEPNLLIKSYHAHVYFDYTTADQARILCETADRMFDLVMGRVHPGPIGPHPMGSCQLGCSPRVFADLLPWLALNRDGLIIFAHPETGDHLADHRDHAIWLGGYLPLDLSLFQ